MSRAHARGRGLCWLFAGLLISSCLLVNTSTAEAGLAFERPNGSAIPFTGTPRVRCGPWDDEVARTSIHVELRGARRGWELSAVRRDLKPGRRIAFPNEFVSTRPRKVLLFVYDAAIEASTAEEESFGSMVFSRLSCRPGGVVEFSIDAVLGSEFFNGTPVHVSGAFRGYVSKR